MLHIQCKECGLTYLRKSRVTQNRLERSEYKTVESCLGHVPDHMYEIQLVDIPEPSQIPDY